MLRIPEPQESGLIPIPVLEDYDVSPITGFVPYPQPLGRLTHAYYQPWEEIMDQLNELMDTRQLRARVDNMPLLKVDQLTTLREQQRAIVVLSIMAQSYVWGAGLDIAQSLPEPLAVPYQAIANVLQIPPALTYASNDLWNWKLIDENGPYTLDNLSTLHVMTGTQDEVWFDIVAVAVEIDGGAALEPLLEAIQAVREDDLLAVVEKLLLALPQLQKVGKTLGRMFEKCDPAVFYWKIRKFLAGSEDSAGLGLPNGLVFKGVNNDQPKHYMGATAGQSSIFAALDLCFGVHHLEKSPSSTPTTQNGETTKTAPNAMLQKMSLYMPGPHRAFLHHLAKVANLREYVLAKSSSENFETDSIAQELVQTFDACLHQIKLFRDTHIQIVTRYIMTQARRGPPEGWEDYRIKVVAITESEKIPSYGIVATITADAAVAKDETESESSMKGSGGSDLMPFLKTNRDETQSAKVIQSASKK